MFRWTKALWFNIQAEGQGSQRQAIKYREYPFSEQKQQKAKVKVKETDPTCSQIWLLPVPIPYCQCPFHSLVEKGVTALLIASSDGTFRECPPSVPVFQTLFFCCCCCSSLESVSFTPVALKKYSQPKSWELWSIWREFWELQAWEAASQVKEFGSFLCMARCKSLGSLKSFIWYVPQLPGACILYSHILSFVRAHRLTLEGCNR